MAGWPQHRFVDFTRRRTIFDVIQEVLNDFANLILPGYRVCDGDDKLDGKVFEFAAKGTLDKSSDSDTAPEGREGRKPRRVFGSNHSVKIFNFLHAFTASPRLPASPNN